MAKWKAFGHVTVASTLAESAARESGAVAEQTAQRKVEKCRDAFPNYCFQPIAVGLENLGAMNSSAVDFINTLGRRVTSVSGEDKESAFLFQRISITIQRFNSILLFESFPRDSMTTVINSHSMLFCFLTFVVSPWNFYSLGQKIIIIKPIISNAP